MAGSHINENKLQLWIPYAPTRHTAHTQQNEMNELFINISVYRNIEISSWEVVTYGIYARVNLFSQNERASATSE